MLAYSGRGSLATGPVELELLLREMGDLVAHSIAKGANLRYEFAPGLPPVLADVTQVRQLALNLIVNASDALAGRRGTITLRTALVTLGPDDPAVAPGTFAAPGEYVQLEVTDTGHGMDAATVARMFDPFFSTKSVGRGLGLAATLGIVKGHGGAIRVISAPGAGTTFQVLLRPTEALRRDPGRAPTLAHVDQAGRVLLVDDEPTVRTVARRVLERAGFEVVEAADGPEAIERFRAAPGSFEGVILDLTLPTIDGMTVLRDLRAVRPDLPVVLCSGWSADEVAGGLAAMPRTLFLQKPFGAQAMIEALVQVSRGTGEG
jgi:CheY-like chemotaxis protein